MGYALTATPVSRGFMLARDFILPLPVFALALSLPFMWVIVGYTIIGQAHFVMTYIYQARGKKMTRGYLILAAILAAGFGLYFVAGGWILPLVFIVAALFAVHFAIDELTLHDSPRTMWSLVSSVLFMVLFFSFLIADMYPAYAILSGILVVLCMVYGLMRVAINHLPSHGERYLWYVAVLIVVLTIVFPAFSALNILACVIWLHAINWAIGYGVRLRGREVEEPRYWILTILTFIGALMGWALFYFYDIGWLGAFFGLAPYYAWAIAHILLSFYASRGFAQVKA